MFEQYQAQATRTFKEHKSLTAEQARLLDWGLGIGGESGEVEELIKHHVFSEEPLDKMKLAKELGDVLWYISALCQSTGISLKNVAELNLEKLNHRYHSGDYSHEESANRHASEKAFEQTHTYQCLQARICGTRAPLNIIMVGPDGAGKTTIAKLLQHRLAKEGIIYHKCSYVEGDKPQRALDLLDAQMNVLYDRFYYPDDIIYSRVQQEKNDPNNPIDWDDPYWKSYNNVLRALCESNTVFVYVTADMKTLKERSKVWADEYVAVSDLEKICMLYDKWFGFIQTRPVIALKVDTTNGTPEEHVAHLSMCIHRSQALFAEQEIDVFLEEDEKELAEKADQEDRVMAAEAAEASEEKEEENEGDGN